LLGSESNANIGFEIAIDSLSPDEIYNTLESAREGLYLLYLKEVIMDMQHIYRWPFIKRRELDRELVDSLSDKLPSFWFTVIIQWLFEPRPIGSAIDETIRYLPKGKITINYPEGFIR
jgi:hypothetical protein